MWSFSHSNREAHSSVSAENRSRIHNLWAQHRFSKTKWLKLNTHEAFLCLTQGILVTRAQPHLPEICLLTLSVNHTINDFRGNHNPSQTTHNISTLNMGEASSNYSVKFSLSPLKSSRVTFLDSLIVDLFKIPDVNQRLKRSETYRPCPPHNFWPGQKWAWISILPHGFQP